MPGEASIHEGRTSMFNEMAIAVSQRHVVRYTGHVLKDGRMSSGDP
jgi:hypothetical protein